MSLLRRLFSPKKENHSESLCDLEKCAYCGAVTSVPVSQPIESRPNFISGCGQLCPECFAKLCDSFEAQEENSHIINSVLNKTE